MPKETKSCLDVRGLKIETKMKKKSLWKLNYRVDSPRKRKALENIIDLRKLSVEAHVLGQKFRKYCTEGQIS